MNQNRMNIDAKLAPDPFDESSDFRATVEFIYIAPEESTRDPEIEIVAVTPVGIVAPIDDRSLFRLAHVWLETCGHSACCRLADERGNGFE